MKKAIGKNYKRASKISPLAQSVKGFLGEFGKVKGYPKRRFKIVQKKGKSLFIRITAIF